MLTFAKVVRSRLEFRGGGICSFGYIFHWIYQLLIQRELAHDAAQVDVHSPRCWCFDKHLGIEVGHVGKPLQRRQVLAVTRDKRLAVLSTRQEA